MVLQHSYGVIPLLKTDVGYDVLLVQHIGGHWSFPKGHIEKNEIPLQTAKRELFEETGISNVDILPYLYFDHYYSFTVSECVIHKRVGFFVGEVYDKKVTIQEEELKNSCRKSEQDAIRLLTFASDKNILKKVYNHLK